VCSVISYEYPLNERIRSWLRLEHLLRSLGELIRRTHPLDHHFALQVLFDIMEFTAREDLKTTVLTILERKRQQLEGWRSNSSVSQAALNDILTQLDRCQTALGQQSGKVCQKLLDNDWLMGIRNRMGIPAGTCCFDLPTYHAWQQYPAPQRQRDLFLWASSLGPLADAVQLLLRLLRQTGSLQKEIAERGVLQKNLQQERSFQLLRLKFDTHSEMIPEISANRIMLSIRLLHWQSDQTLAHCTQDIPLELALCA